MQLSARRKFMFIGLIWLVFFFALEIGVAVLYLVKMPHYEMLRLRMGGGPAMVERFQHCVGQPYLLFVPTPNYTNPNGPQHNRLGFRGKEVPMRRTPGVARVLCLGGSTTYGWYVPRASDTWPAEMERLLEQVKPPGLTGVEVINGGLPWGSSAELLTHYLYKYRYWKPDLVILHTGGNDADPELGEKYQPDYSHWRQALLDVRPLPEHSRWLMRSRAMSFLIISLFYTDYARETVHTRPEGDLACIDWYPDQGRAADGSRAIPPEDNAFRRNLTTLVREVQSDGAKVLLVPFRPSPNNQWKEVKLARMRDHEAVLEELSREFGTAFARFPTDVVKDPASWQDDCHLNAAGSKDKASYLAPYAAAALWPEAAR